MKAAIRLKYGPLETLKITETASPQPKSGELLIRVQATTVSRTDCAVMSGKPYIIRLFTGLVRPKHPIPGTDFAGCVEAVGADVSGFKTGDRVCGFDDMGLSSQAEYVVISARKSIMVIPEVCSYAEAAASLEGAHYAYNFMNKVRLLPGQKVVVNGATGAIGSALVQFLKHAGLQVTAVCRGEHTDLINSIGADRVIDYRNTDFTQDKERYDYVFDAVGKSTFSECKRLLNKKGIYISSELGPYSQNPFLALITPIWGGKKVIFPIPISIQRSMTFIKDLLEKGAFKPIIDRSYPLEEIKEAYHYAASGQKLGNIILSMNPSGAVLL